MSRFSTVTIHQQAMADAAANLSHAVVDSFSAGRLEPVDEAALRVWFGATGAGMDRHESSPAGACVNAGLFRRFPRMSTVQIG